MFGKISSYTILSLLTVALGLGSTFILTRTFSIELVGKYFTFTYFFYLLEKIFNANTPTSYVFFKKVDPAIQNSLFAVDGTLYFLGGIILFFVYFQYGLIISFVAMFAMVSGCTNFIIGHYKYEDKFFVAGMLEMMPVLLRFIGILSFSIFTIERLHLFIFMFLASYLISNFIRIYLAKYYYSLTLVIPKKKLVYYTLNISLINSLKNIPRTVDVLLIGAFFSNSLVAPYKVAKDIGNAFLMSMDPMFSVLFSDFRKNLDQKKRNWLFYSVISTILGLIVLLVWVLVGPRLIISIWGENYSLSMNYSLYIMGFSLVAVFNNPLGAFMLSKGREKMILIAQIFALGTTSLTWLLAINAGISYMIPIGLIVYKLAELTLLLLLEKWKTKT